jgi:FixJ family two-component response regulator
MIGNRPTIFVVDDDPSVRKALERLLFVNGYNAVSFPTAEEFLNERVIPQLGCLVLDVNLPGLNGLELQSALMRRGVSLPIIFITGHGNIPMAVRAVKTGATGFLTKPFSEKELVSEIENALAICQRASQEHSELAILQERLDTLSPRERQILSFVVSGKLNKQTAFDLGIVENTVKVHRRRVMTKMHAQSVAELVLMAHKLNLVSEHQTQAGTHKAFVQSPAG